MNARALPSPVWSSPTLLRGHLGQVQRAFRGKYLGQAPDQSKRIAGLRSGFCTHPRQAGLDEPKGRCLLLAVWGCPRVLLAG